MLSRFNFYAVSKLAILRSSVSCSACIAMNEVGRPWRQPHHYGGPDRPAKLLDGLMIRYYSSTDKPLSPTLPTPPPPIEDNNDKSQNIFQRLKTMTKKYWYIVVPVHIVTSTMWFGSFYYIACSGVDLPALLGSLGSPDWILDKVKNGNSWTGYMVIAYGLYKISTPLRYMVTLGGTTMTIRYLNKFGYVFHNPKKPS